MTLLFHWLELQPSHNFGELVRGFGYVDQYQTWKIHHILLFLTLAIVVWREGLHLCTKVSEIPFQCLRMV